MPQPAGSRGQSPGRVSSPAPRGTARPRPFLCFADRDPEDLVCGAFKVVGSAQRRRAGAILQHGSVLLRRSPTVPEFPGVSDLFEVGEAPSSWADPIAAAIVRALGLLPTQAEGDDAIRRRAAELERTVYRDPAWTGRRP